MLGKRDGIPAADDGQTETRLLMTCGRKRRRLVLYKYHTLLEETPPIEGAALNRSTILRPVNKMNIALVHQGVQECLDLVRPFCLPRAPSDYLGGCPDRSFAR